MGVDLLKHNQEAYEKVKGILKTNNKTCVIQPTGSGKTHLALKLTDCSSEGLEFKSQQPHGGSQPSVMGSDALFWCV